ncbi:MAG TPA: c-type cytochrome [Gemmatimonadaceae bacterium]|jgi:cytochrome c1|nr:c-type cytochrome [Gemmatimonadaceae bacterium]
MTVRRLARVRLAAAVQALALLVALFATACSRTAEADAREAAEMTGGDPSRGPALMRKYGCQSCHTIPGVVGADGLVGPPLAGIASRSYIGGVLPNAPDNMLRWIRDPRAVDPLTAMPNTGVTPSDARHIVAYLYTLR